MNEKQNKGITLIALVITIIIMLILASITVTSGMTSYKNAKLTAFVIQMQLIQRKVDEFYEENTDITTVGQEINQEILLKLEPIITSAIANNEIKNDLNYITTYNAKLRYFNSTDLEEAFQINDVKDELIINFETREVISLTGIEYENIKYYTQYKLPNGQKHLDYSEIQFQLGFDYDLKIDGLTATINIKDVQRVLNAVTSEMNNGILSYSEVESGNWKTIENNEVIITKSGNYKIRLIDLANSSPLEKYINIRLTNKPDLDGKQKVEYETWESFEPEVGDWYNYGKDFTNWAYAKNIQTNEVFVWVPRYAYKTIDGETEIKFLKGTSIIPTDESVIKIDAENWIVPEVFTQGRR